MGLCGHHIQPQQTPKPVTARCPETVQEPVGSVRDGPLHTSADPKKGGRASPALPVGREYHRAFVLHFLADDFPKVAFGVRVHSRAWFILLGKTGLIGNLHSKSKQAWAQAAVSTEGIPPPPLFIEILYLTKAAGAPAGGQK